MQLKAIRRFLGYINKQAIMVWSVAVFSFSVCLKLVLDQSCPDYYNWLFLLPLSFGTLSLVSRSLYKMVPGNLGISVLLGLMLIRMVISPLFLSLGGYVETIPQGAAENTFPAIILIVYETVAIFLVLHFKQKKPRRTRVEKQLDPRDIRRNTIQYAKLLAIAVLIFVICVIISPELFRGYRSIIGIGDKNFTSVEDAFIVEYYGTTFVKKLALVCGQYLIRALLLLIPGFLISVLSFKPTLLRKLLSFAMCFLPLLFIGGTIALSLIYVVCLVLLCIFLYYRKYAAQLIGCMIGLAAVTVLMWWLLRTNSSSDRLSDFARIFSAYFSGVNVVSGTFNMPYELEYRLRYFLYDFSSTIPFGNTIFALKHEPIQTFFNTCSGTTGQIPTTIGMGYYYFGAVFAPLYSVIFALVAFGTAEKLQQTLNGNPISYLRMILITFYFAMGVIMYNIDIIMTSTFSLFIPMYLMEIIAFKKGAH